MITEQKNASKILLLLIVFALSMSAFVAHGQELTAVSRPARSPKPENPLRERAYFIADALAASSSDISDKLQAAHLRADIAGLICGYGERAKAVDLYRKGIGEIVTQLVTSDVHQKKEGKRGGDDTFVFELALQLSKSAAECDPSSKSIIAKDLQDLRVEIVGNGDNAKASAPGNDSSVVPDDLWGTQPSVRRRLAAEMMVSAANDKITAGRIEEGEEMLRQSLASCVVVPFITSIKRLWKEHQTEAASLFILAARQVKGLPSGSEFHSLNFGFGSYLLKTADPSQEVDSQRMALVDAYLDSASALIQSQDNEQVGRSTYALDNIKSTLPLYARFRSASSPQVVQWINEATNRLPADKRNASAKVSTGPESPEDQIARFENIASKSDDPKIKDQAYASMVSTAISSGNFQQAADWVARILDVGLRREMQDDLIARQTQFALAKGSDSNEVVERLANVSATPLRVKLYTQVAKGLCKKDSSTANFALQEALSITLKMDASPTQSHLLLSIADAFSEFDSTRAFEVLRDASKSIGRHKDQPPSRLGRGTLDLITVKYDSTFTFRRTMFEDPDQYKKPYDLSVFRKLARVDFDGSLLIASQVEDKLLQASAKYEICAGILLADKPSDSSIPPTR